MVRLALTATCFGLAIVVFLPQGRGETKAAEKKAVKFVKEWKGSVADADLSKDAPEYVADSKSRCSCAQAVAGHQPSVEARPAERRATLPLWAPFSPNGPGQHSRPSPDRPTSRTTRPSSATRRFTSCSRFGLTDCKCLGCSRRSRSRTTADAHLRASSSIRRSSAAEGS